VAAVPMAPAELSPLALEGRAGRRRQGGSHAVKLLQVMALTLMIFPSNAVIHAVGGAGYVAALVSYLILILYVGYSLAGLHNPLQYHTPIRTALCAMWMATMASYLLMDRDLLNQTQLTGADRWLLQLAGVTGVVLVASECLRSFEDIRRVMRALVWGMAFCGLVAAMQFFLHTDITPYLRKLPGFSLNAAAGIYGIESRGGVARVAGTGIDPIEMGVVAGMIFPIALYLAMYDRHRSLISRWLPVALIAVAIPTSVSRSAILAVVISVGTLLISLQPGRRMALMSAIPVGLAVFFVGAHHLIGTIESYFLAGSNDNSIQHRLNNYPYVESLVRMHPWFGQGGGTYYFTTQVNIFDNQYLTTVVELGLVGIVVLAFYLLWPAIAALSARRLALTDSTKQLCAVLAGAELAAVICSGTFDSLSFPLFVNVQALVAGLIGAAWLLVRADARAVRNAQALTMTSPETTTWHVNGVSVWRSPAVNGAVKPDGGN
jgi:O-antigen ligase